MKIQRSQSLGPTRSTVLPGCHRIAGPAVGLALGAFLALPAAASAQQTYADAHPGEAVYQQTCAGCHGGSDPRAPNLETLRLLDSSEIRLALTEGGMAPQGALLSALEMDAVIDYLATVETDGWDTSWIGDAMCSAGMRAVDLSAPAAMPRVGVEVTATRQMSAGAAGLTTRDMERLELAWALAFPGVTGLRAAPVVAGSTIFYTPGSTGVLLAIDADSGCIKWSYQSSAALRSSLTLGELSEGGPTALLLGDSRAQVHAVDAESGELIWIADGRADPGIGIITGSVVLHEGKVIVPISASGVFAARDPRHECCEGRGAVTALDAATGERLWTYFTMEEASYTGELNSVGVPLRGPSGAPIWSTPSIDPARGFVYATTGQNTSLPATQTSDAVIAIDIETGEEVWVFQGTPNDVWNIACTGQQPGPNCPDPEHSILEDWDFGGSAIPVDLPDGSSLLLAGQKSGHLWALDPDTGELVWSQRRGGGGTLGGNHWGIAVDGERVFLPINDPTSGDRRMSGMYAFDIATGEQVWEYRLGADCLGDRRERVPSCQTRFGFSATPLVVDGAVVSASVDGRFFVFDAEDGRVLFEYDTVHPYEPVNGVEGHGGSIDSHSVAAGAGMILIGSGYDAFSPLLGNVLLAFRPRGD